MRQLLVVLALMFLAIVSPANAQVQVTAQTERTQFLLYERVDLIVTIQNTSGMDLLLDNNEGHPWLSFLVAKQKRHLPVKSERESFFKGLDLKAGENKVLRINLTPLFSFREDGEYEASAVVDLPGQGQLISGAVPFSITGGRVVWSQVHGVDGSQRTYSLIRFSPTIESSKLYLRVEDPSQNLVYTNLALGDAASSVDPQVFFDPKGCLHVMQPVSMGTYLYTRADDQGKILDQRIFKTVSINAAQKIPPRLTKLEDGNVVVLGGLEQDPNSPREKLSDTQAIQSVGNQMTRPPSSTASKASSVPQ